MQHPPNKHIFWYFTFSSTNSHGRNMPTRFHWRSKGPPSWSTSSSCYINFKQKVACSIEEILCGSSFTIFQVSSWWISRRRKLRMDFPWAGERTCWRLSLFLWPHGRIHGGYGWRNWLVASLIWILVCLSFPSPIIYFISVHQAQWKNKILGKLLD